MRSVAPNPKALAAEYPRPADCEGAARQFADSNREFAWSMLKACVDRGNFTALRALTHETWEKDLQTRPESPLLLAMVIAARGGDIEGDLGALRKMRVPLFTLGAALAQPETYKGRYIVLRGKTGEARSAAGKPTVMVGEVSLQAQTTEQEVGPAYNYSSKSSGQASAQVKTTRFGNAAAKGQYSSTSDSRYVKTVQRHDNVQTETGRQVMVRLAQPDPFLETGREFVFLVRFDGVRQMASDEGESMPVAVVSMVKYLVPSALLIE